MNDARMNHWVAMPSGQLYDVDYARQRFRIYWNMDESSQLDLSRAKCQAGFGCDKKDTVYRSNSLSGIQSTTSWSPFMEWLLQTVQAWTVGDCDKYEPQYIKHDSFGLLYTH